MEKIKNEFKTPRRNFLAVLGTAVTAIGLAGFAAPLQLKAAHNSLINLSAIPDDPDQWFNKITGKHKILFDVPHPNDIFPFAWSRVFLLTNLKTGTSFKDSSIVVVLRHSAIGYAFENRLWEKYKIGELFKVADPKSKIDSVRNPFWKPAAGDFSIPGIGVVNIGIDELQADGVLFCVCDMAVSVYTTVVAQKLNLTASEVKKDWLSGLLPGIQLMPSGVWAVGRAQEHGCTYCFAG